MKLEEVDGSSGEYFTLQIHWRATKIGRLGGLAFQTTELIPLSFEDEERALKEGAAIALRLYPREQIYQIFQGARILEEGGKQRVWLITIE